MSAPMLPPHPLHPFCKLAPVDQPHRPASDVTLRGQELRRRLEGGVVTEGARLDNAAEM
jgi:hypothetical protein